MSFWAFCTKKRKKIRSFLPCVFNEIVCNVLITRFLDNSVVLIAYKKELEEE